MPTVKSVNYEPKSQHDKLNNQRELCKGHEWYACHDLLQLHGNGQAIEVQRQLHTPQHGYNSDSIDFTSTPTVHSYSEQKSLCYSIDFNTSLA